MLFATLSVNAQKSDSSRIKTSITVCENNPQKVTVVIDNPANEKLSINVFSAEHGDLFTKEITRGDFRTNLDFSTAMDGDYTIEVSCRRGEKIRKTITMRTHEVVTRSASLK